ncbi:MAG: hypothetical protein OXL41_10575 [Nitrospinae bacterium]|nr:hypothetical protein [Nitrospinota bacterium]
MRRSPSDSTCLTVGPVTLLPVSEGGVGANVCLPAQRALERETVDGPFDAFPLVALV